MALNSTISCTIQAGLKLGVGPTLGLEWRSLPSEISGNYLQTCIKTWGPEPTSNIVLHAYA